MFFCPRREKEIEQKISRLDVKEGEERGGGGGGGGSAYRPPGARDRAEPARDDRHRKFHFYPFTSCCSGHFDLPAASNPCPDFFPKAECGSGFRPDSSVVDPHWFFNADLVTAFISMQIRIQGAKPMRIRIRILVRLFKS
jgi:hypothetical protein